MSLHRMQLGVRDEGDGVGAAPACEVSTANTDYWGLRIGSIFIILVGSALGALLPVVLARTSRTRMPKAALFVAKYFGTGVILATAWMHLLSPASDNLRDECLGDILPDYDWAMAIGLMTVMVMFLLELIISHFDFGFGSPKGHSHGALAPSAGMGTVEASGADVSGKERIHPLGDEFSYAPNGTDHLGHQRDHVEGDGYANYAAQITAIFVLEFGVIFHSIFIGLTLAVTDNFIILFVVLVFHQTFEGFGLGARLAMATWPKGARGWTPYILGMLYAISTPLSIGMGLVANETLSLDAATSKVVNGVFDAISGGILMYTGLVELVAHEFMFSPEMRRAGLPTQLAAYACVATGVGLMALLAKWA